MAVNVGENKKCSGTTESMVSTISRDILPVLPNKIRELVTELPGEMLEQIEEIRLRQGKPLMVGLMREDVIVTALGQPSSVPEFGYIVTDKDLQRTVQLISGSSVYAFEEEIKNGFITVKGGHRVGIAGKVNVDRGRVRTIKYITGLNIRIAREVIGAADRVMPYLVDPVSKEFHHTLIISPPRCGKTTLMRDIVRQISMGMPKLDIKGYTVGVVDERSEIAGCFNGVPQKDVGIRTDVLDGCPKAEGMMMLIRAMGPQIIATDEIGKQEDASALEEALNAGIKVLTTAHGADWQEISQRPVFKYIIEQGIFERLVILGRSKGVGTVEDITDLDNGKSLMR
ncbi:MAG: stage III sporulation protein AA [Eubacteriales bacterium]